MSIHYAQIKAPQVTYIYTIYLKLLSIQHLEA